jgi:hypothetical protein
MTFWVAEARKDGAVAGYRWRSRVVTDKRMATVFHSPSAVKKAVDAARIALPEYEWLPQPWRAPLPDDEMHKLIESQCDEFARQFPDFSTGDKRESLRLNLIQLTSRLKKGNLL